MTRMEHEELSGAPEMFRILIWVVVSWMVTNVKIHRDSRLCILITVCKVVSKTTKFVSWSKVLLLWPPDGPTQQLVLHSKECCVHLGMTFHARCWCCTRGQRARTSQAEEECIWPFRVHLTHRRLNMGWNLVQDLFPWKCTPNSKSS